MRNLGKKHYTPAPAPSTDSGTAVVTVTPAVNGGDTGDNVVVTVQQENVGNNVPKDLGTTTTTKIYRLDDGTIIKKEVITVHKVCENGILTTTTTTKTYTYGHTNNPPEEVPVVEEEPEEIITVVPEEDQGENVVVVIPEAEAEVEVENEAECETTTVVVTPENGGDTGENVVVVVEAQEEDQGQDEVKDLGKTITTKIWRLDDGTIVKKQVITVEKTCANGLITTKTTTKTYTYTYTNPGNGDNTETVVVTPENGGDTGENVVVVVNDGENVPAEEDCDMTTTTVIEAETPDVGENVVVVVEEQEEDVGQNIPKDLGKTTTTKIYRTEDGTIVKKEIITVHKTCLNGIVTITTTTKTITYNNTENNTSTEVAVEQEAEDNVVTVPVEPDTGENVVVVVDAGGDDGKKGHHGKKW